MMVEFSCIRYLLLLNHTQKIILNRLSISALNYCFYIFLIINLDSDELINFGYIWVFCHILINFGSHIIVNPIINLLESKNSDYYLSAITIILVFVLIIYLIASLLLINFSGLIATNLNFFFIFLFVSSSTIFDLVIRYKTILNKYNWIIALILFRFLILLSIFLIDFWIKFSFDLKILYFSLLNLILPLILLKQNFIFSVPKIIFFKIFQFHKYELPKFIMSFFSLNLFLLLSYEFLINHEFLSYFTIIFGMFGFLNFFFQSINEIVRINIKKIDLILKRKIYFIIKLLMSYLIILSLLLLFTFVLITYFEKNNYLNGAFLKYSYIFYFAEIYFSSLVLNSFFDSIFMVKKKNNLVAFQNFIRAINLFTIGFFLMIFLNEVGFLYAIIISLITYLIISIYFLFSRV